MAIQWARLDPMAETVEMPIFPLGSVLFPGGRLGLRIFEPRYVEMIRRCLRDQTVFGVTLIRAGFEVGKPAIPHDCGCTARIADWQMPAPEQYLLRARGEQRFHIRRRWALDSELLMAEVELIEPADPLPLPRPYALLGQLLGKLIDELGTDRFPRPARLDDAAWVAYRLAEMLPVPPELQQALLELDQPRQVLEAITRLVQELPDEP